MKYRDLSELQNTYPKTPETISQNYKSENGEVIYNGIFPENFLTFKIISIDDINFGKINIAQDTTFRFIVNFINDEDDEVGQYWTSQPFLDDLRKGIQDSQPYFNRETVTLASVDFDLLHKYWMKPEFAGLVKDGEYIFFGEKYAEVSITETIDTKEEMLKHINWLVSDDTELREVKTFGSWVVETTTQLGFTPEEYTPSASYLDNRLGAVDARNSGAGGLRDAIGGITGSPVPDGRSVDRNAGSGDLRDPIGDITGSTPTDGRTGRTSIYDFLRGR